MLCKPDPAVEKCRKHPKWSAFHRACGKQGLFFDNYQKQGRTYIATAVRCEIRGGHSIAITVANGTGSDPIAASIDAVEKAAQLGFPVDPAHGLLFTAVETPPPAASIEDILGITAAPAPTTTLSLEDLLS